VGLLFWWLIGCAFASDFCYRGLERFAVALRQAESEPVQTRLAGDHPINRPELLVKEGSLSLFVDKIYLELPYGAKTLGFDHPPGDAACIINENLAGLMARQRAFVDSRFRAFAEAFKALRERLGYAQRLCPWAHRAEEPLTDEQKAYVEAGLRQLNSSTALVPSQLADLEREMSARLEDLDPDDTKAVAAARSEINAACVRP